MSTPDRRRYRGVTKSLGGVLYTGISPEMGRELYLTVSARLELFNEDLFWYDKLNTFPLWKAKFKTIKEAYIQLDTEYVRDKTFLGSSKMERQLTISKILNQHYSKIFKVELSDKPCQNDVHASHEYGLASYLLEAKEHLKLPDKYIKLAKSFYSSSTSTDNFNQPAIVALSRLENGFTLGKYQALKTLNYRLEALANGRLENLLIEVKQLEMIRGWKDGNSSV